jgi:hypothetical protein
MVFDSPPLVPEMEPKKLPLIPLHPAIPTNPNIIREFRSVSHVFLDSLPLKIQERLSTLQCLTLDMTLDTVLLPPMRRVSALVIW